MNLRLKAIGQVEWEDFLEASEESTFFHSPGWYSIYSSSYPLKVACIQAIQGNDPVAIFPYCTYSKKKHRPVFSGPIGSYGGPLLRSFKDKEYGAAIIKSITQAFKRLEVRQNPYSALKLNEHISTFENTQVIYLQETLAKTISQFGPEWSHLFQSSAPKEASLSIFEEPIQWRRVYELSKASSHPTQRLLPLPVLRGIYGLPKHHRRLFACSKNNRLYAALICLYSQKSCFGWRLIYNTNDDIDYDTAASVLHTAAIEDAQRLGLTLYDFMPSQGQFDELRVKNYFNPSTIPSPLIRKGF